MKKLLGLFLFLTALNVSCASPDKEKEASVEDKVADLESQVMAQHDSTMTYMGALYGHRKTLTQWRDSLTQQDTATIRTLNDGIEELAEAEESMMGWMRAYRAPEGMQPDSALAYLAREKEKITIVQKDIDQSLQKAETISAQFTSK